MQTCQFFMILLFVLISNCHLLLCQQVFPACAANFPTIGMSSEMTNPSYLHYDPIQQVATCGAEMGINPAEIALRRTISAPVSIPDTFLDSCFTVNFPYLVSHQCRHFFSLLVSSLTQTACFTANPALFNLGC